MKRASSRLLLGLLGVATSAGLVLGGKAVVESVAKGAAEVNAAVETADQITFEFTNNDSIAGEGWTANPSSGWNADSSRGISLSKKEGALTYTLPSTYGVSKIDVVASANAAGYTLHLGDDSESVSKANNVTYTFENLSYAPGSTITLSWTLSGDVKSIMFKSVTFYKNVDSQPSDVYLAEVSLEQGDGKTTVYQNSDFSTDGFVVTALYKSEAEDPDYVNSIVLTGSDDLVWSDIDTSTIGVKKLSVTYEGVKSNELDITVEADPLASAVSETLTADNFEATSSTYKNSIDVTIEGGADVIYQARTATSSGAIQLRSSESDCGIVMSSNNTGNVIAIEIAFEPSTSAARTVSVYGNNTAYVSAADLYNTDTRGELVGEVVCSDGAVQRINVEGDYLYLGVRSKSGALYLDYITLYFDGSVDPNIAKVQEFVDTYMHLDDYNANEGKCLGADGYYVKARTALIALGEECIELFKTAEQFAAAKKRYENWAKSNGDDNPYSGTFTASAASRINNDDHAEYWIVGGISIAVIGVAAAMFFLPARRKRPNTLFLI